MKNLLTPLFTFFILTHLFSQKIIDVDTKVSEVTVFLRGAEVQRSGNVALEEGRHLISIRDLTPNLDAKSIQVKIDQDVQILSVKHAYDFSKANMMNQTLDSLNRVKKNLDNKTGKLQARREVINEKLMLLSANKSLGSQSTGVSVEQLKQALSLFDMTLMDAKNELLTISLTMDSISVAQQQIRMLVLKIQGEPTGARGVVEIELNTEKESQAQISVSYVVKNAGWYPKYDLRVESIEVPLELVYKADMYQQTGEVWKNVKLVFSNGSPNERQTAPSLVPWKINYSRYTSVKRIEPSDIGYGGNMLTGTVRDEMGEILIGANISVKGSVLGTITDMNGEFSLVLPPGMQTLVASYTGYQSLETQVTKTHMDLILSSGVLLSEVAVRGSRMNISGQGGASTNYFIDGVRTGSMESKKEIVSVILEKQLTVEFEAVLPYTILSDGKATNVELITYRIPSEYLYETSPKIVPGAFLLAKVTDWDKYHLLSGEANLFVGDSYIGRTLLDPESMADTLEFSLGRDRDILLSRSKVDELSRRTFLGANTISNRSFKISVRNRKTSLVHIFISDQIPVSVANEITVTAQELSNGKVDENTGIITWDVTLSPGETKEIVFTYSVKYPSKESVALE